MRTGSQSVFQFIPKVVFLFNLHLSKQVRTDSSYVGKIVRRPIRLVVILPGIKPGSVVTPLALRCSALDHCAPWELKIALNICDVLVCLLLVFVFTIDHSIIIMSYF